MDCFLSRDGRKTEINFPNNNMMFPSIFHQPWKTHSIIYGFEINHLQTKTKNIPQKTGKHAFRWEEKTSRLPALLSIGWESRRRLLVSTLLLFIPESDTNACSVTKANRDQRDYLFHFNRVMTISIVVTCHETRPCSGQVLYFLRT